MKRLFSTVAYQYLRDRIAAAAPEWQASPVETRMFPDGERYQRIGAEVHGCEVALVGGTVSEADTLELYDLACGLVENGARFLTLVVPYFGYSTMERAVRPLEIVTAKTRARLLSSIPVPGAGSRILLLDLHSEGLPYYFEGALRPLHLYAKPVVMAAARRLGGDRFVIACTDAGRAKWVESLATDMHVDASFVFKRRDSAGAPRVTAVSAHVEGEHVIIYDDMIRTGSSLINAARAYKDAGAARISAIATHGLFPTDALHRIADSGLFDALVTTDSHPRALQLEHPLLRVESIAPLLAANLEP